MDASGLVVQARGAGDRPKRAAKAATRKRPEAAKEPGTAAKGSTAGKKTVRSYKRLVKHEISEAFPEIVHTLIDEAKHGSVHHTKLLFDLGGVKEQAREERRQRTPELPSFTEVLIEQLKKLQPAGDAGTDAEGGPATQTAREAEKVE